MFCDQTILTLNAGKGGNGCIAFRREKFIARGGPNGGDGGKGGNIYFRVNTALNSLVHLDTYKQFTAEKGEMGKGQDKHGKNAEDLTLEVPLGTIIREVLRNEAGEITKRQQIADLSTADKVLLVVKGGKGGFGNAHFATSVRQAPKFAELGEDGEHIEVELELKLVADIAIIGIPSAGKSTLISVISNAKPKIAEYHFTTLTPHLGVVKIADKKTYVVADIPGLIEGAHSGKGLGIKFLKHIQRCRILVHLIDPTQADLSTEQKSDNAIINNFTLINQELEKFSEDLATKKQIIVINKSDVISDELIHELKLSLQERIKDDERFQLYPESISAVTTNGVKDLKNFLFHQLQTLPSQAYPETPKTRKDHIIYRPHLDDPKYFSVEKTEEGVFQVAGRRIIQIVNMTDVNNREAMMRVHDVLKKMGISKELKKQGIKDDDVVHIGKHELIYHSDV